jgi:pimeloyl-ACP methyl ester carboxylesterase
MIRMSSQAAILAIGWLTLSLKVSAQSGESGHARKVTSADGVSIAYEVHGKGRPVIVFVHGWSCDRTYWKDQVAYFSERYKVVTIDLGGHGESGTGRTNWTIYSFGTDVATVIRKLGLKRALLVGHSMGGDVIVDAALQAQGRVSGLILCDAYKSLSEDISIVSIQNFVKDFAADFHGEVHEFVKDLFLPTSDSLLVSHVADDMAMAPPAVALSALSSSLMHGRQITHDLEKLKLPVVSFNPDDTPTDKDAMRAQGVDVAIMPGVGHFMMLEDPKTFNELLEKLIRQMGK